MNVRLLAKASIIALAASATLPQAANAQGAASVLRDEIFVTATKKADAENVQDVPLAVTAYGDKTLDALKVRDLESLATAMPNVALDDVRTTAGTANFSIRGLGVNSSIPSIDPTVGVFNDGVYLGVNAGVVFDVFDLESVEVLRGPQGILFGRNVTGGAVLMNSKRPSLDGFDVSFKTAVESGFRGTGNNYYVMGAVNMPLGDSLAMRVSAYFNDDNGWFENRHPVNGREDFGKSDTFMIRPSFYWAPSDTFDMLVRYEHGESKGDGPASQNHTNGLGIANPFANFSRDSFDFSIDGTGFFDATWDQVTVENHLDVDFGDGTITNIFGWREYDVDGSSDIDATPLALFHAPFTTDQNQISNEIRYNGRFFDAADLTLGFYYFTQDLSYNERRNIAFGTRRFFGGGVQDQRTWAIFGQVDLDLSSTFTVNLGARYTNEKKDVVISNLVLNSTSFFADPTCDVRISGDCMEDFVDSDTWKNFTPKVGFEWAATDFMNVYGHWTQGVRSGGYNFRNTSLASLPIIPPGVANPVYDPLFEPGPFDEETVNAFEIGFKAQPGDGAARINAAIYYNDVNNMQRELNLSDPLAGVVQVITNTADAHIFGIEIEGQYSVGDNLVLMGSLGHANGDYDDVIFDLNGDGMVDAADKQLGIPRLSPWTYAMGFVHTLPLGGETTFDTRFNFSHRDASFYTDNNLGVLNAVDIMDASMGLNLGGRATVSLYGKNLLNEVNFGNDTQLPVTLGGGTFSPLMKGRVVGVELQLDL